MALILLFLSLPARSGPIPLCPFGVGGYREPISSVQIQRGEFAGIEVAHPKHSKNIQRRGRIIRTKYSGSIVGAFEAAIVRLIPLHPVPNPLLVDHHAKGSPERLEEMTRSIQENGYDLARSIDVAILPNGSIRILAGHHRVESMRRLGEVTIPARVYIWSQMSPSVRNYYREIIIEKHQLHFPEFYRDINFDPTLLD